MVKERRAGLEPMRHSGNIDFHHEVVGQVGVDVGPVGPRDEAIGRGELGIEKIERRAFKLLLHRLAVAILLVHVTK